MSGLVRELVNPTLLDCHVFLMAVEDHYHVSIRFWLDIRKPEAGSVECWVCAAGSGTLFDNLPAGMGIFKARVLNAQGGNIYPAMWTVIAHLENHLFSFGSPVNPTAHP